MTTIGLLYPGYAAEDDYPFMETLLPEGIGLPVVHTSLDQDAHEVEALLDLGRSDRLLAGAREFAGTGVDALMWACTSGSFVFGWNGAKQQVAEVAHALGVPASSTSIAFIDALERLGVRRVAIAATYPDEVSRHFEEFLATGGYEVLSLVSHDIPTAALAGELDAAGVIDLARSNDAPEAEVVLLPDTALHTARIIPDLERELGKPVLTANQVTVWKGLQLAGRDVRVPELGTLFGGRA